MPYHGSNRSTHKGFSLLELLLVIFIISLVYFLGFEGFEKPKERQPALTPLNLKSEIMRKIQIRERATLLCVDNCKSCYLRNPSSSHFDKLESATTLGKAKVYWINEREELYHPNFGRYHDHKICLLADFYPNGSSTPFILENEKGIYFLPSLLREPKQVDSLEAAQALWLAHTVDIKDRGNYY